MELVGFGAMDAHISYEFIWLEGQISFKGIGAIDVHISYEIIGFGAMDEHVPCTVQTRFEKFMCSGPWPLISWCV